MSDPRYFEERLLPPAWVFIDNRTLAHQAVRNVLFARGYRDDTATFAPSQVNRTSYTVWRPR
jgi:hypothetical protein